MHRAQHLEEERLFDCYLATQNGERVDPPVAEHLADCRECSDRYADLTRFMDDLNTAGTSETDAIFTAERLRAQQYQIARRLEHLGHPARVIAFPGAVAARHLSSQSHRSARRWVAAAAAAGLFIGVATGLVLDRQSYPSNALRRPNVLARQTALPPGLRADALRSDLTPEDAAFLSEIEIAGDRPRTPELIAFDALTPHVREITLR